MVSSLQDQRAELINFWKTYNVDSMSPKEFDDYIKLLTGMHYNYMHNLASDQLTDQTNAALDRALTQQ